MKLALLLASLLSAISFAVGLLKKYFWEKIPGTSLQFQISAEIDYLNLVTSYCERSCCDFLFHYPRYLLHSEIFFRLGGTFEYFISHFESCYAW